MLVLDKSQSPRETDKKEVVLEQKKNCEITDMSLNKLILRCVVSCEGDVELSGPNSWSTGVTKVASGGGTVQKAVPLSADYSGKYRCKYKYSDTSSVEQMLTIDPLCSSSPTFTVSNTLPKVGQK